MGSKAHGSDDHNDYYELFLLSAQLHSVLVDQGIHIYFIWTSNSKSFSFPSQYEQKKLLLFLAPMSFPTKIVLMLMYMYHTNFMILSIYHPPTSSIKSFTVIIYFCHFFSVWENTKLGYNMIKFKE